MIKNELQYKLTKSSADNFEKRLNWLRENSGTQDKLNPIIAKAEQDGLQSMIDELREEIQEYERTKQGDVDITSLTSVQMVPTTLIKARIAKGLSQRQLAQLVGLKEQQIQRYESNDYSNVDLGRVQEIARALSDDASTGAVQR